MVRRFVCQQHRPLGVQGENRGWTALDQNAQLLFGVESQIHFVFQIGDVLLRQRTILVGLKNEKSGSEKCREHQDVSRNTFRGDERERIEHFHQERAEGRGNSDLPPLERDAHHQHGE